MTSGTRGIPPCRALVDLTDGLVLVLALKETEIHRNVVSTAVEVDLRPASDDIGERHALDADAGK
jgi:hypothetical protein